MQKLFDQMQIKADTQFKKCNCDYILSDLKLDFDSLSSTPGKKFIWVIRDMGTELYDVAELALVDSNTYVRGVHFTKQWRSEYKVFILDITKQTIKSGNKSDIEKVLAVAKSKHKNMVVKYQEAYGEIGIKQIKVITSYLDYAITYAKWAMEHRLGILPDKIIEIVEMV